MQETLESLSLGCTLNYRDRYQLSDTLKAVLERHCKHVPRGASSTLPKLTSLTLRDLDLSSMFRPFSLLINLAGLSKLNIFECDGVVAYLSDLVKVSGDRSPALEHLGIQFLEEKSRKSDDDVKAVTVWLETVCNSDSLQSLHMSWRENRDPDDDRVLTNFLNQVVPNPPNLISFSMYGRVGVPSVEPEIALSADHSRFVARPKLRAFGYRIGDLEIVPEGGRPSGGPARMNDHFMVSLSLVYPVLFKSHAW